MSLMKDFFKNEIKTVQIKTGIRQLENIMSLPNWESQLEQLINLMVDETSKPPFDLVGIDVKQRVISNAIIEDKDFIGLNPKFVRRAIMTWWNFNKDKYFEKIQHEQERPQNGYEPLTGEARMKWLKIWEQSLSNMVNNFTSKEQREADRPKGSKYKTTTEEEAMKLMMHNNWIRECFDPLTMKPNEYYLPENEWLDHQRQLGNI